MAEATSRTEPEILSDELVTGPVTGPGLDDDACGRMEPTFTSETLDDDQLRAELAALSRQIPSETFAPASPQATGLPKALYIGGGSLCVALGGIGIFVPGLPTTVFMIVALWAFTRSSPEMRHWLYTHRQFGPALQNWVKHRSIPTRARQFALGSLLVSALFIGFTYSSLACLAFILFVCLPVASFLWTLPVNPD